VFARVGGGCETTGKATATVAESEASVTIVLIITRPVSTSNPLASCPANAIIERVPVSLAEPLGNRQVVDGNTGTVLTRLPPKTSGN
jgi:hypothetical protein